MLARARQYDPIILRLTSRDPIRGNFNEPLTLHAYLYCLDNPINRTDPSGEWSLAEVTTVMGVGSKIYTTYSIFSRAKDYAKRIASGANLRGILLEAAFEIGCDLVIGKGMGMVAKAVGPVGKKLGKRVRKAVFDKHHVFAKFLQGDPAGIRVGLTPKAHRRYHKLLREGLKKKFNKTFWRWKTDKQWKNFLDDPLNRVRVGEVLMDTALEFDQEMGGDVVTTALIQQLTDQNYFIF